MNFSQINFKMHLLNTVMVFQLPVKVSIASSIENIPHLGHTSVAESALNWEPGESSSNTAPPLSLCQLGKSPLFSVFSINADIVFWVSLTGRYSHPGNTVMLRFCLPNKTYCVLTVYRYFTKSFTRTISMNPHKNPIR